MNTNQTMKPKQSGGTEFNDWIRLEDREPNDGQNVIAVGTWFGEISGCGESEYMGIGTWSGNIVSIDSDIYSTTIIDVTHWIPLPCYPTPYGEF